VRSRASVAAWVALLAAASSQACTESSTRPGPTGPYLNPNSALATVQGAAPVPLTHMIFVDPGTDNPSASSFKSITFSATVQSEDDGRQLAARVFGDWQITSAPIMGGGDVLAPSVFDDVRTIRATLTPQQLAQMGVGCHQVALVVSHTFDGNTFQPVSAADTSFLVWWISIEHTQGILTSTCPMGRAPTGDAGTHEESDAN
jgi:hypothetical protein